MKKRTIVAAALCLYAVLLAAVWHVGTFQARARTEALLDYAVNDIRWSGDPYFITRGLSDLAAGQPMAIQFERDNALWEATLQSAE